jgi:uncharacterized protein
MIFDADVHITDRAGGNNMSIGALISQMDRYGVDKALCWPMVSYTGEVADDNRAIAVGMKNHPDRIIGFGGLNPMRGLNQAKDELKKCINDYGLRGVKLNGARDGYYVDSEELAMPLIEEIVGNGLLLSLHCGINDPAKAHPWRIGNIAERFPEATVLMIHMGGAGAYPALHDSAFAIAKKHENIHLVGSEADPRAIVRAISDVGADRVLYGSDTPFVPMKYGLALYKTLLEEFTEADAEKVMGNNMAKLLR